MKIALTDLPGIAGSGLACLAILLATERLHHARRVDAEWTRKLAHVLMGGVACTFPWVFASRGPVLLLCASFVALMAGAQWRGGLPSLHQVRRRSAGTALYPAAVAVVFLACGDRPALYVPSILVLAVPDVVAAVVGQRFGRHPFAVQGQGKTIEGSLAFFAAALACLSSSFSFLPLPPGLPWMAIAVVVAALGALTEALSPLGIDNATVPLATCMALSLLTHPRSDQALAAAAAWLAR
jgi:phytol kinase